MPVTLKDVAKKTQLTPSSVSKILNPKKGKIAAFSPETCKRVFEAARILGYQPNKLAQSMAKGKTYTLGLLCGDLHTPYFSELAMAAMVAAEKRDYHLLVSVTKWDKQREIKCLEMLMERQVEGILMHTEAPRPGDKCYDYVTREKFPVVFPNVSSDVFSSILSDWQMGFDEAVAYLKQKGHRKIGMVRQSLPSYVADPKYPAFLNACEKEGIQWKLYDCLPVLESAQAIGRQIIKEPDRPSALIVYSDYVAAGIISGLGSDISIPKDIAIVGIDGTQMGKIYRPSLTTIDVGISTLAEKSIDLLLHLIEHPASQPEKAVLPAHLIIRESA